MVISLAPRKSEGFDSPTLHHFERIAMDEYDIKVIREEGEDTRRELEKIRNELKDTNRHLLNILMELMKMNRQ